MPIYVYECHMCGHISEKMLKVSERDTEVICTICGETMYRDFNAEGVTFHLKGGCWAKQGYDKSDRQMVIDSDKECMDIEKENKGSR